MSREPVVKRQGASGKILEMVKGLLAKGKSIKEVSDWARVDLEFIQKVKKELNSKVGKK